MLHLRPGPISWQPPQPPFLPRFLASKALSHLGFRLHPDDLWLLFCPILQRQKLSLREKVSYVLKEQGSLLPPLLCSDSCCKVPSPHLTERETEAQVGSHREVVSSGHRIGGGPVDQRPCLTHTLTHTCTHTESPWACLHTHHMVDGQGSGGDADVEAAAGLADGHVGGHGAAVPSSKALRGKESCAWNRPEKGEAAGCPAHFLPAPQTGRGKIVTIGAGQLKRTVACLRAPQRALCHSQEGLPRESRPLRHQHLPTVCQG